MSNDMYIQKGNCLMLVVSCILSVDSYNQLASITYNHSQLKLNASPMNYSTAFELLMEAIDESFSSIKARHINVKAMPLYCSSLLSIFKFMF